MPKIIAARSSAGRGRGAGIVVLLFLVAACALLLRGAQQQTCDCSGHADGTATPVAVAVAPAAAAAPVAAPASAVLPTLCGGPDAITPMREALHGATAAMLAGPDEDLAQWKDRGFTRADVEQTARLIHADGVNDLHVWVEIKNKTLTFPKRPDGKCKDDCGFLVSVQAEALERGMREGHLRLPEGVPMLFDIGDTQDTYSCRDSDGKPLCPAPILAVIKHAGDGQVLVPAFWPSTPIDPHFVPWEEKLDVAVYRGTPFCNEHPLGDAPAEGVRANCSRAELPALSLKYPHLLNASSTQPVHGRNDCYVIPGHNQLFPHSAHAQYKYLLNLDGMSASRRMAALLSINSAVLKQASSWVEWYYRAIKPCVHYLEFWKTSESDVLDVVRALQGSRANQLTAQRIAGNGQAFAFTHLSDEARWRYWERLMERYASLYRG